MSDGAEHSATPAPLTDGAIRDKARTMWRRELVEWIIAAEARTAALAAAIDYAVQIIEAYESDMRSVVIDRVTLAERGVCQGAIYRDALDRIQSLSASQPEDDR